MIQTGCVHHLAYRGISTAPRTVVTRRVDVEALVAEIAACMVVGLRATERDTSTSAIIGLNTHFAKRTVTNCEHGLRPCGVPVVHRATNITQTWTIDGKLNIEYGTSTNVIDARDCPHVDAVAVATISPIIFAFRVVVACEKSSNRANRAVVLGTRLHCHTLRITQGQVGLKWYTNGESTVFKEGTLAVSAHTSTTHRTRRPTVTAVLPGV